MPFFGCFGPCRTKRIKKRRLTMFAIAGVIGAGLFAGSGAVIHSTGPEAIVFYALAGGLLFCQETS
jgi:GABA permease